MRLYFITFLLLVLSFGNLNSQEGSKIDLRNVNVGTKRLPTIFLFGEEYTARNRDDLLRGILKSQFYRPDLNIIINLEEFISKRTFSFRHKGPIDIMVDGKRLRNQNVYNTNSLYGQERDQRLLKLINEVKNVRIDSNLNGILERRVIKKEIESINDQIAKLVKKIRPEIETFPSSENFILDGILDSFDIVVLVSELEKNFQISIDGEEVTLENFKKVSTISSLISQYLKK